ncbi:MAG: Rossmann-like and DUF2520 domain-containing protein [Acidobacteriota bacterium]
MAKIAIIGAGRLGTSLGRALASRGHHIKALSCRRASSAAESRRIIGQGLALTDNAAAAQRGNVIFLCLPDEKIQRVAEALSKAKINWEEKTVFHTSGLLPARALQPLKKKGALTASIHPIQSFARKTTPPSRFRGIYFGLEGDRRALAVARGFVRQLGGRALVIPARRKPFYHAAFVLASNFPIVLLSGAVALLRKAGIGEAKASRLLYPLLEGTLRNVKKLDIQASLTGPIVRGDAVSVRAHLQTLGRLPQFARVYRELSLLALELAKRKGLSRQKLRALRRLLEGK